MPQFDPLSHRYVSQRNTVYARNGVACTSVPVSYTHLTLPTNREV